MQAPGRASFLEDVNCEDIVISLKSQFWREGEADDHENVIIVGWGGCSSSDICLGLAQDHFIPSKEGM